MSHAFTYRHDALRYYSLLLQRYARRILRNDEAAGELVKKVLYDQHCIDGLAASPRIRDILETDLLNRCEYILQEKNFDRPMIKRPAAAPETTTAFSVIPKPLNRNRS